MNSLFKHPSAWLPVAMSFAALTILIIHVAIFGLVRETDEGTAAHLFQALMAGQLPIIAYFAIKWLPQKPKQALLVLTLQFCAGIMAFAPVYILEHWQ